MKRTIKALFMILVLSLSSCIDDVTSLNVNPKAYSSVPGETMFSNAMLNLTDAITYGVTFKVLAQQWSETTYTDASRYNLPNLGNGFWNTMYRDVLRDLKEAKTLISEGTGGFEEVRQNKLTIIDIMEVYVYSIMVNTYGDIPYTEALDADKTQPVYDDGATVYASLFDRIDADIAALDVAFGSFGDADIVYDGDVAHWKKFANSLKLRMAMTLADVDNTTAKREAEEALAGELFESNADNALMDYLGASPNTNPIWDNLVQSGREDYVASNTLVDLMEGLSMSDPRIAKYFTPDQNPADADGVYSGGTFGVSNNYGNFSHAGSMLIQQQFPGTLLDYSEIQFYVAEAAVRGYTGSGSAEEHYNEAIRASITSWEGSDADADDYLADADVAFATAAGTDMEKIARQKYIALYNRGLEAWTEYRRFDFPVLNVVPVPLGDFPSRYTYPVAEQNLNEANWQAASDAIGGDEVTTRVFWDVN